MDKWHFPRPELSAHYLNMLDLGISSSLAIIAPRRKGKTLMAQIDQETTIKGIPPNIQRSIQRLSEANLISQIHKGKYYIEKPGLKRYLNHKVED